MTAAFDVPPKIILGGGARKELAAQLTRLAAKRILLVTDPGVGALGFVDELRGDMEKEGFFVALFDRVQPDPTDVNVTEALECFQREQCDAIVALGGGSVIDAAKGTAVLAVNPLPLRQYMGYHKIPRPGVPLIAIPTTAGTGSEATKVTIITDTERSEKMMILDAHLLPRVALVDYQLTMSMPPHLTAAVGVDTLTHGIEAFVSRKANPLTDGLALNCISLVARHLRTAYREPRNEIARERMMAAACLGGMAFANSSVCLVHGMSRPLGAIFHLPHGLSNAVLLPTITRFSLQHAVERYAIIARTMGCAPATSSNDSAAAALIEALEELNSELCIPKLRHCRGMEEEQFLSVLEKMSQDALASGSPQNNPRVPSGEEIVELYRRAW